MIFKKGITNPTKSEIISIAHSNNLLADRIMLSAETAVSRNWINIVKWLDVFLKKINKSSIERKNENDVFWKAVREIRNIPLVIFTKKGYALEKINETNDRTDLTVFTDSKKVKSFCAFKSNIVCILIKKFTKSKSSNFILEIN